MKKLLLVATSALVAFSIPAIAAETAKEVTKEAVKETAKETAEETAPAAKTEEAPAAKETTKAPVKKELDPRRGNSIESADVNGDGIITKEEFLANSEKFFIELDGNKDGKVTKTEVDAKKAEWRKKMQALRDERRAQMQKNNPNAGKAPVKKEAPEAEKKAAE